jgi:putative endonuclease
MKILARNYRCPEGEADLVALDCSSKRNCAGETIVFVEVKTRSDDAYTDPESAVDGEKRRRMRGVARYYLAGRQTAGLAVRFDIVSVVIRPGRKPEIRHLIDVME